MEFPDAVPESVRRFARTLIDRRCLATPLEIERLAVDAPALLTDLRRGVADFGDVEDVGAFTNWAARWVREFGALVDAKALSLRMVHSRKPMCPRFHVDNVRVRLICALVGPGSEWLRSEDVSYLPDDRVCQQVHPGAVQQLASGSIGLFRGVRFRGGRKQGVVHRSPQTAVDRVVMTMDIVDDA